MSDDRRKRLDEVIARRDSVERDTQRLQGRLEAALGEVARIEGECRAKGLDPAKLDASIKALQKRYVTAVSELETQVEQAEKDLSPFLREDG